MTTKNRLIEKLYKGLCSKEELETLLDLIRQEDPSASEHADIIQELWDQLENFPELEEPTASLILERTLAKIEKNERKSGSEVNPRQPAARRMASRRKLWPVLAAAASLLLLLGIGLWLWWAPSGQLQFHTAYGEQRSLTLPDGSVVKLNANSSLAYYPQWNDTELRQVWLEGEAYFEVAKNEATGQKFQVITKDLTVEVLGTIFNVNTRSEATEVFLEEGKVNIDLPEQDEDILMAPGELVTYSPKTKHSQKKQVQEEAPASWKDGTALFQGTPLREIIQTFEEIYGIETVVENASLLDRKFNLGIPVDNLETAYEVLKELTGLQIEKQGNRLTIK